MSLLSITYVSAARQRFSTDEIEKLLAFSRVKNAERNVTGLLLYWDGNFLQYIEGPPAAVEQLLDIIRGDSRHDNLIVLDRTAITERAFPDWRMGYQRIAVPALAGDRGVSNFLVDGDLGADTAIMAPHIRRLIELFREQLR